MHQRPQQVRPALPGLPLSVPGHVTPSTKRSNTATTKTSPNSDPAKHNGSYPLGAADEPAAEAMGKGGQYQRLLLAIVILAGELGAFLLARRAGARGDPRADPAADAARVRAGRAGDRRLPRPRTRLLPRVDRQSSPGYLARKVIYSLILAVILAVCQALDDATSNLGWLLAFALQAAFLWTVFLQRNKLAADLLAATAGPHAGRDGASRLQTLYYATRLSRMAGLHRQRPPVAPVRGRAPDNGAPPPSPSPTQEATVNTPPPPRGVDAPNPAMTSASRSPQAKDRPPSRARRRPTPMRSRHELAHRTSRRARPPARAPDGWAQTCVTRPPRAGDPDRTLAILAEARRVLRDDGTLWVLLHPTSCPSPPSCAPKAGRSSPRRSGRRAPRAVTTVQRRGCSCSPRQRGTSTTRTRSVLAADRRAGSAWARAVRRDAPRPASRRVNTSAACSSSSGCILAGSSLLACGECGAPYRRTRPGESALGTASPDMPAQQPLRVLPGTRPLLRPAGIPTAEAALCTGRSFLGITDPADR